MALVEVFVGEDSLQPIFVGEFNFLPRIGDHLSKEEGDYFSYYSVVKVWHREDGQTGIFKPCVLVELDD